jgi:hypothetical protein
MQERELFKHGFLAVYLAAAGGCQVPERERSCTSGLAQWEPAEADLAQKKSSIFQERSQKRAERIAIRFRSSKQQDQ